MEKPPTHDEGPDDKGVIFGMHIGDLGIILIAFLCTVVVLLILFQESPFQKLEIAQKHQAIAAKEAARQAEIAKVAAAKKGPPGRHRPGGGLRRGQRRNSPGQKTLNFLRPLVFRACRA